MKKAFVLFVYLILFNQLNAQINKQGIPFITNYTPQQYGASDQNWAIVEDHRGVMYFGNNDNGILEYDGVNWRKIPVSNNSIVRSLALADDSVIYAGAVDEFGFLQPDKLGKLNYVSLTHKLDSSQSNFSDIFKTYTRDSLIYFCSRKFIFIYNNQNGTIKPIPLPAGAFFSFLIQDKLYLGDYLDGLKVLDDDQFTFVPGGEFFAKKGIYFLEKIPEGFLVGTFPKGLFKLLNNGAIDYSLDKTAANNYLINNQLYHSYNLSDKHFAFSTLNQGLIIADLAGSIQLQLNKALGLQDETVILSYLSNKNTAPILWLGLNKGISKTEINSPIKRFGEASGIEGAINDITMYRNSLFVATNYGVYYASNSESTGMRFMPVRGLETLTWSLLPIRQNHEETLLAGTTGGLYAIDEKFEAKNVDQTIRKKGELELANSITKIYQPDTLSNEIFIGKSNGLFSIVNENGTWKRKASFKTRDIAIRNIFMDKQNNIWLGTYFSGVFRISFQGNDTTIYNYGEQEGINSNKDICFLAYNNQLIAGTGQGLLKYNASNDKFEPFVAFGQEYSDGKNGILKLVSNSDDDIWITLFNEKSKWVERINGNLNSKQKPENYHLKRLPNEQFDAIFTDKNGITWLGSSSGLYSYDKTLESKHQKTYATYIRKVFTRGDSLLFYGYQEKSNAEQAANTHQTDHTPVYELNYEFNDISFEYAAPFFIEEDKTTYQYYLEGYKDNWSNWNTETRAVFTNLSEGNYIFKVKAKNIYGTESSMATYHFVVLPPWYRTILAYIFYSMLAIALIIGIVKVYTRKLEKEKILLEQMVMERTAEIRKQKEDIENKNKVLHEQKEEITASIMYAQRIQKAIVPSEELARKLLKNYFLLWKPRDIVSGDFWWLGEKNGYVVATAADCTGHGVPGAFMSMLGVSFLNEIVKQQNLSESHIILNQLREKVKTTLGQSGKENESKDGMDMALLVIDYNHMKAQFSGAYNPLYLYRNKELIEFKADRNPIGIYIKEKESFTQHLIDLQTGDTLYIFSDGFADQFGGDKEKKYSSKRFKELLLSIQDKAMDEQKVILNQEIEDWRGTTAQIDDIIVLGIRI